MPQLLVDEAASLVPGAVSRWPDIFLRFRRRLRTMVPGAKPGKKTVLLTLTEAQRGEIRQAFDLFDTEGQGASMLCCTTPLCEPLQNSDPRARQA